MKKGYLIYWKLQQLLKERNIKQSELAHATGIDKGAISSYLKGKYIPKQSNINLIANFFSIPPSYLIDSTNSEAMTRNNEDIELLISKANDLNSEQLKQLLRIVDVL